MCKVNILRLIEGAKQAEGLTVIIDVFRAFSLECYLYDMNVAEIRPIGSVEDAFALKEIMPNTVLIGERNGKKCEGFDFGNSPSTVLSEAVRSKTILHTTSAGTQGIVNATKATEIITGSLVNAKAVAEYIKKQQPEKVSLVCMGNAGVRPAAEDELCAEYIKSLVEGTEFPEFEQRVADLQKHGGDHFFDENRQEIYPKEDFFMCVQYDKFPFVIKINKDEHGFITSREYVF